MMIGVLLQRFKLFVGSKSRLLCSAAKIISKNNYFVLLSEMLAKEKYFSFHSLISFIVDVFFTEEKKRRSQENVRQKLYDIHQYDCEQCMEFLRK